MKDVKRLDWTDVFKGDPEQDVKDALTKYFEPFAEIKNKELVCISCGGVLGGFFGTFRWGLAHGEGFCRGCGYPGRAHHYIKMEDGSELLTLRNFILQYHPDFVEKKAPPE